MIIAFQVVLLIIITISFVGIVGEKKDEDLRNKLLGSLIASMVAFVIVVILLLGGDWIG